MEGTGIKARVKQLDHLDGWILWDGRLKFKFKGQFIKGWSKINGDVYFFDKDGFAATGFANDDNGNWYFFDREGRARRGRVIIGQHEYFFGEEYKMVVGTRVVNGEFYYYNPEPVEIDGRKILLGELVDSETALKLMIGRA